MSSGDVTALLREAFDHTLPQNRKFIADQQLNAFAKTVEGLHWALHMLQTPTAAPQELFFAASVLETAARRSAFLAPADLATLRQSLWAGACPPPASPQPHYVTSKLTAALSLLACLDARLPLLDQLDACLNDAAQAQAGVRIMSAFLDQLHALSQATSASLRGKILYSQIPEMQSRLKWTQPAVLHRLCTLLDRLTHDASPPAQALAATTLEALRSALGAGSLLSDRDKRQGDIAPQVATLVLPYIARVGAATEAPVTQADHGLAVLAMGCLGELLTKPQFSLSAATTLDLVLPALSAACQGWAVRWAHSAGSSDFDSTLHHTTLCEFVKLLSQLLSRSLGHAAHNSQLAAPLQGLLEGVMQLAAAAKTPAALLAAAEVWHAVLSYLDELDAESWGGEEREGAASGGVASTNTDQNSISAALSGYKHGILHLSRMLLAIMNDSSPSTAGVQPPFSLSQLDFSPGSGGALDEWLAAAGDGEEDGGRGGDGEDDDLAQDFGDLGGWGAAAAANNNIRSSGQMDSEAEVFSLRAESFIGRAAGTYARELTPLILAQLGPAAAAAGQAAAALTQRMLSADEEAAARIVCLRLDFALRLTARCGPHLPSTGLQNHSFSDENLATLSPADGAAFVLRLLRALLGVGADWVACIGAVHARGGDSWAAVQIAVRMFSTLAALLTIWLPQAIFAAGQTDAEVQRVVSQLAVAVLDLAAGAFDLTASLRGGGRAGDLTEGVLGSSVAVAAGNCVLSLTSVALSSGMGPQPAVLQAVWSSPAVVRLVSQLHSFSPPPSVPVAALRPLSVCLSDLALRSWGALLQQPVATPNYAATTPEERRHAFQALVAPLLAAVQQLAAAGAASAPPQLQTSLSATVLATEVVKSYTGSPKLVRSIAYSVFIEPLAAAVTAALPAVASLGRCREATAVSVALLRLLSAVLQVFPAELGADGVGMLLTTAVTAFSSSPDQGMSASASESASFAADMAVLSLVNSALAYGGNRHQALAPPAMGLALQLWDKACAAGATHVKARVLATLLSVLRHHWRSIGGSDSTPAPLASTSFSHLCSFFSDAAEARVAVPSAVDVRAVLEDLFELQTVSKLFWKPYFGGCRDALCDALLAMLLSRMFTGAQEDLVDILYSLASSNWSTFQLGFVPEFAERRLGTALGPRAAEVAARLGGGGDMNASEFEKCVLAFVNDAMYWSM